MSIMQAFKSAARGGLKFCIKNGPTLMTGAGIVLFGVTVYEAAKSSIKVKEDFETKKEEKIEAGKENTELTKKEKAIIIFKRCWKVFLIGLISIGFFCGANHINLKRQAALGAAYAAAVKDFTEYKEAVVESIGETKAEKIEDEIAAKHIKDFEFPVSESSIPGTGPLWNLSWVNIPFRANLEDIRKVFNDLNEDMYKGVGKAYFTQDITLNDFIETLSAQVNAPQLGRVDLGDALGWNPELTGNIDYDIRYGRTRNGEPMGYIKIKPLPLTMNLRDLYE